MGKKNCKTTMHVYIILNCPTNTLLGTAHQLVLVIRYVAKVTTCAK